MSDEKKGISDPFFLWGSKKGGRIDFNVPARIRFPLGPWVQAPISMQKKVEKLMNNITLGTRSFVLYIKYLLDQMFTMHSSRYPVTRERIKI